jgi:hypothetical protein
VWVYVCVGCDVRSVRWQCGWLGDVADVAVQKW